MIVLYRRKAKEHGELQIGWPSWDPEGKHGKLSVRFAYQRKDGKFARTSPEVPLHILYEMNEFVGDVLNNLLGKVKPSS